MDAGSLWKDILTQNRDAIGKYFCKDAVIRWHCTNEQFTVSEFIRANCEYPGSWDGIVERTDEYGDTLITVVNVFPKDRSASYHVVSFFRFADGRISSLDEYWADDGDTPEWRKRLGIGKPIH